MKPLLVVGTFNDTGGKPSAIGQGLIEYFDYFHDMDAAYINGGSVTALENIFQKVASYDTIIWMPNLDNSLEKYLPRIKELNPKCLLVSSKRVIEKTYTEWDVIGRLLKTKSNLGIMIEKVGERPRFNFKLLDPLGNLWANTDKVRELAEHLYGRLSYLHEQKRVKSLRVGDARTLTLPSDYLKVVRWYGQEFHKYVNAMNPNRFLGNTSTRCMMGFPGIRGKASNYFISRRNVDKGSITSEDFVEVCPTESHVEYYGDNKPSVDTPVQIRLFNFYKNVNFIVHGHVYVKGAPKTFSVLPCGATAEFEEILNTEHSSRATNFVVNLKGHGCIILARDINYLEGHPFESRPFPEKQFHD